MNRFKIFSLAILISSSFMPFLQSMEPGQPQKNLLYHVRPQAETANPTLLNALPAELKKELGSYLADPAIKFWQNKIEFRTDDLTIVEIQLLVAAHDHYTKKTIWDLSLDRNAYNIFKSLSGEFQQTICHEIWIKFPNNASPEIDALAYQINQAWFNDWNENMKNLKLNTSTLMRDNLKVHALSIFLDLVGLFLINTKNPCSKSLGTLMDQLPLHSAYTRSAGIGLGIGIATTNHILSSYSTGLYNYFTHKLNQWKNDPRTPQSKTTKAVYAGLFAGAGSLLYKFSK